MTVDDQGVWSVIKNILTKSVYKFGDNLTNLASLMRLNIKINDITTRIIKLKRHYKRYIRWAFGSLAAAGCLTALWTCGCAGVWPNADTSVTSKRICERYGSHTPTHTSAIKEFRGKGTGPVVGELQVDVGGVKQLVKAKVSHSCCLDFR